MKHFTSLWGLINKSLSCYLVFYLLILSPIYSLPVSNQSDPLAQRNQQMGPQSMVDESPQQVLKLLESLTHKIILTPQNLPAVKISFETTEPMSNADFIRLLESLLALNGIALTPLGDKFLKAVPTQGVSTQAPEFLKVKASSLPASQKIYTAQIYLRYLNTKQAENTIRPFLTPGTSLLLADEKNNSFFITDSLINLQRVENLLGRIDQPSTSNHQIKYYSVQNVNVTDLDKELTTMIQTTLKQKLEGNTEIFPSERTNQLIVTTHPANHLILNDLISRLDIDVDPLTQSQVLYLKHAKAEDVQALIEQIISKQNDQNSTKPAKTPETTPTDKTENPSKKEIISSSDPSGNITLQFSEHVNTIADQRSNAIVAYGTKGDLRHIKDLVDKLDVQLAQVQIETIIAEVTLEKGQTRGIDSFGFNYDAVGNPEPGGNGDLYSFSNGALGALGITTMNIGREATRTFNFQSILGVAQSKSNVQVLSAPTIVTTHNQEAKINVSQSEPVITGSVTDSTGTSTSSSIQFRDIGIQLTVTPLIGSNGAIQMEIEQLVENKVSEVTIDGNAQPVIGKREAKSFVTVNDRQIVILGGLQETRPSETKGKIAFLGQIPVVGDSLFTRKVNSSTTRELLIFIRPRIIKDAQFGNENAEEWINNSNQQKEILHYLENNEFDTSKNDYKGYFEDIEWIDNTIDRFKKDLFQNKKGDNE